jgi:hypothetical protein
VSKRRIHRLALFALTALIATSCSKIAPTQVQSAGTLAPAAAQSNLAQMDALLDQGGMTSFDALGARLAASAPAIAALPTSAALRSLATSGSTSATDEAVQGMAQRLVALAGGGPAHPSIAIIAPEMLGRTMVYDPTLMHYVVDPNRTGAPTNGIRYILYAEDTLSHQPIVTEETGTADVMDEGTSLPIGFALRLLVHNNGIDVLDYTVSVDGTRAAGSVQVGGFIASADDRANFLINIAGVRAFGVSQAHVDFWFELVNRDFRVAATINRANAAAPDVHDLDEAVRVHGHLIHIVGQTRGDTLRVVVHRDGLKFASISGLIDDPVVLDADGQPLDADDRAMLARMLRTVRRVNRLVHCLLQPAHVAWALSHPPAV